MEHTTAKNGRKAADLTGQRYGLLTALFPTEKRQDGGSVVWHCACDCGAETDVCAKRLKRGKVRSCGCLSEAARKDLTGQRFGRLTVTGYEGKREQKNAENYWSCVCDCGKRVSAGQTELMNGETRSCGCYRTDRLIDSMILIDGTSVTVLKNLKNKVRKSNKSGCTGVFEEKSGKWIAYINFRGKRYWLGRYDRKEDAVAARKRGEEMHDDFLNWYENEFKKHVS